MIAHVSRSGPGMINTVAAFCHETPEVTNRPNIGNLLVVIGKVAEGKTITDDEVIAAAEAYRDPEEREKIEGIFQRQPPPVKKSLGRSSFVSHFISYIKSLLYR